MKNRKVAVGNVFCWLEIVCLRCIRHLERVSCCTDKTVALDLRDTDDFARNLYIKTTSESRTFCDPSS